MIIALDHVQLAMPPAGEEQARRFYRDVLGLAELPKPANLAARGGCWFESGSVRVHLGVEREFIPARKAHPGFVVSDIAALTARLKAAGAPVIDDEPLSGWHRIYSSDPFGNRIEFMQPEASSRV